MSADDCYQSVDVVDLKSLKKNLTLDCSLKTSVQYQYQKLKWWELEKINKNEFYVFNFKTLVCDGLSILRL